MHTLTKVIRLFIDGVLDDANASIVETRARSIAGIIGCQISSSGLCTIHLTPSTPIGDIEFRIIKQLTFDK